MIDVLIFAACVAALGYFAGYYTGVVHLKNRNANLHRAIQQHRLEMEAFATSTAGTTYQAGFIEGQKRTLDAIDAFVGNYER